MNGERTRFSERSRPTTTRSRSKRIPSEGTKTPAGFQIVVKAKYMGAVEIGRMTKLAKKEDLRMSLRAVGDSTFMVLA